MLRGIPDGGWIFRIVNHGAILLSISMRIDHHGFPLKGGRGGQDKIT